jgi:hypothetical protein
VIDEVVVASRVYQGATWDFRSYVGLAFRTKEGQITTGLLDYEDKRIAVRIGRQEEPDSRVVGYHVFVGLYLDRVLKIQDNAFEVFRLHRDIRKYSFTDDYDPPGEVLSEQEYRLGRLCLSIERFKNMPPLADTSKLTLNMLADRMNDLYLPCPYPLAPESMLYKPCTESPFHPGMSFNGNEAEVELLMFDHMFMPQNKTSYVH